MIKSAAILLLLCTVTGFPQARKPLPGKVVSGATAVGGVFVINTGTGTEAKTAPDGSFTLDVRMGDRLAVYSDRINTREFAVNQWAVSQSPYVLEIEIKSTELDEVVVGGITAENLGIVPKGQKQYTQMERKLNTTGDFKPVMLLGLIGGAMPLDPLINAINGRTKRVKKELETERTQLLAQQINDAFTDEELTGFGLTVEQARGFIYYIAEDSAVRDALKTGNEPLLQFRLTELAQKYSTLQQEK